MAGNLAPDVSLDYDSQSVDGEQVSTNSQSSWIGDGWSYSPGFIERTYVDCADDPAGYLRDWDGHCAPGTTRRRPATTTSCRPHSSAGIWDPCMVTRAHVEAFQAWMIETRSASTALNKHKGLQQFFKWLLVDEQAIDRNPMDRVRQPKTPTSWCR
jgi:hypothetical protein